MTSSKDELVQIRDGLWAPEGRSQLEEQLKEARLRLLWIFGSLLGDCLSEERILAQIEECLRGMGPRTLDPREWAERFVAHGWLSAPGESALWERLESALGR